MTKMDASAVTKVVAEDPTEESGSEFLQKSITLFMMVAPLVVIGAMWRLGWPWKLTWIDFKVAFVSYVVAGIGISVGFHRLLTHRSFEANAVVRFGLAVMGMHAIEGPPINWVADHNKHHAFTDEEGDPHSPHAGFSSGVSGTFKGLWHAHWGWLLTSKQADRQRFARGLLKDPAILLANRLFGPIVLASFVVPFAIGWTITGKLSGGLGMFFWAGVVRMCVTHHTTWSINSICHMFGTRPFTRLKPADRSTNFVLLALFTFGEAWHHNHHAFPTSAYHGLRWWERMLDPAGWVIWWLKQFRLIRKVNHPSKAEWKARLAHQPA